MENQPMIIIPNDMASTLPDNSGMKYIVPVNVSGWAIAAGYLGLLSFAIFFAPISVVVSILAFQDLKKHPHLKGKYRAWFGLILGIIFSIGLGIIIFEIIVQK